MPSATLDRLLNRGLPRSPRARALTAELAGRSLAIEIPAVARVRVSSDGASLSVTRDAQAAEATLTGGPFSLLSLAAAAAPQAALQRGAVTVGGDAELAQKFRELLHLLRPDLAEELSLLLGDVAAHQLTRLARLGLDFGRRAARVTLDNLAEYLAHERGELVPRNEGEQFLLGVDALRERVDRLGARLELLTARRRWS